MSEPLLDAYDQQVTTKRSPRVVSLDVFRGLCVFLMILVDYGGSVFPISLIPPGMVSVWLIL
ncbi:hypothetical protein F8388_013898 [Cannabis sativa]|uniref:Uncharacterized protein n=1 Tax=Cannabis sativa TaxID=3483 RepID=A0A7J6F801_CANSA|nr:hypothetical protein F8388_013898 [Cannabis sativa]